jgi:uncharacterized membrane protein YsdA (DUF1294 family)
LIIAILFCVALAAASILGWLPLSVIGWYGLVSAATFIVYSIDKSAARHGRMRIPERTLHVFSLAGGWPGAALAQAMLRHKSNKSMFRAAFWMTAILNCAALVIYVGVRAGMFP